MDKNEIIERLERLARCAIHTVGELPFVMSLDDGIAIHEAIDIIQQPQRKKGRWIKKTIKKKIENDYSCSECGRHVSVMRGYDVRLVYPFCHCGAEMEGQDE